MKAWIPLACLAVVFVRWPGAMFGLYVAFFCGVIPCCLRSWPRETWAVINFFLPVKGSNDAS